MTETETKPRMAVQPLRSIKQARPLILLGLAIIALTYLGGWGALMLGAGAGEGADFGALTASYFSDWHAHAIPVFVALAISAIVGFMAMTTLWPVED